MTLEEILSKLHDPYEHALRCENGELTALLEELKERRAADVQPVIHAEWIDCHDYIVCSNCGLYVNDVFKEKKQIYRGCPRCLARMNGGSDNGPSH